MMKYNRLRGTGRLARRGEGNFVQGFGGGLKKGQRGRSRQNGENIKTYHKIVGC